MNTKAYFCLLLTLTTLAGCSPRWPHRFDNLAPHIAFQGFGKAIVLTRDQRQAVTSNSSMPQEVGVVRSVANDRWPIQTASGRPLAQDISTAVCNSLVGKGFECVPLVSGRADVADELDYLQQTHMPLRVVFITVDAWDAEVYFTTTVRYDLSLKIFNADGETMAAISAAGEETLGKISDLNPAHYASQSVPGAMEQILQTMLNQEKVAESMNMVRSIDALGAKYR